MATIKKQWSSGTGEVTINYDGDGNGQITISSDGNNLYEARSMQIVVQTTAGSPQQTKTVNISQAARVRTDISNAVVTAANQTYSGSALTPTPTVKLNGVTIPSTGYDVAYSNNTNAGTATVTVTGKGDYTGTASGTFTIAKANPTYTAPTAKTLTYSRSAQAVLNAGSTSHGTIQYSSNGTSWSTSIPTKTNAGTYTVYWKLIGDSNHNDIASTSISVTIAKATPVVATAPSKRNNLTYSGSAQNLLSGGSMKHSSSDSTSVAGTFTYAQGTNAGTYSSLTWSFAPTDSTNYNSTSGTVSGSVSIGKASRTLSFPNAYVVLAPSGNITKTATPSAGSGDGAITYSIGSTTYATINSSSGKVTAKTTEGNTTVTATIAEGTNYLSASATYTLYVFATTHNYDYSGSAKSLTLPPGSYKLQVWGAQGGALGTYTFGKGGYSEGQLTLNTEETVYINVGGQGAGTGDGGFNGGGSGSGHSEYYTESERGSTSYTGGGGASDIRTGQNSLYSRVIVAGGGSGSSYYTKTVVSESTAYQTSSTYSIFNGGDANAFTNLSISNGSKFKLKVNGNYSGRVILAANSASYRLQDNVVGNQEYTFTASQDISSILVYNLTGGDITISVTLGIVTTTSNTERDGLGGYSGGGVNGDGLTSYCGKQNSAGANGAFGSGANQSVTTYRYVSGCGGGGWYGGGSDHSNSETITCKYHGGGSGFVNTSANAQYRPSGYTGLQLDSGTTKAGTQTFVSPSGTNETGHSGNGYARITRL